MSSSRAYSGERVWPTGSGNYSAEDVARLALLLGSSLSNGIARLLFDRPLFTGGFPWYVNAGLVIYMIIFAAIRIFSPRLRCPACGCFLENGVSRCCPQCGSDHLDTNLLGRPHCESCGRTMRTGLYGVRRYQIRACTACGLMLDHGGL